MLHPVFGETLSAQRREESEAPAFGRLPSPERIHAAHVNESDPITIRFAKGGDLDALQRLIEVDGGGAGTRHMLLDLTRPDVPSRVLAAFAAGKALAAVHVDSGHEAADPFEHSSIALELLRTRVDQIRESRAEPQPRRFRRFSARRGALSPR